MSQITISKKEYTELKNHSKAYKKTMSGFFDAIVKNPIKDIVADFKKTGLYTEKFLSDLENGLKKSSYSK
jgi:hypothetical protein